MALPTSPPISLNQIKTEFGATGTRSLTEFYRGGAYVPNISANSGVPTSGTISLLDFLGATNYTPHTATAAPTSLTGSALTVVPSITIRTTSGSTVTASPSGRTYTYAWQRVSGSTAISAETPNSSASYFRATVPSGQTLSATWRCAVSDGTSTAYTNNITITLTHTFNPGGGGDPEP